MKKVFRLFESCRLVCGSKRVAIIDIQRNNVFHIPLDLYEILSNHNDKTKDEILNMYKGQNDTISEYYDFLEENELGFWTNYPEFFPKMDMSWDAPTLITNAILDIDTVSTYSFENAITQLDQLGCQNILIRYYSIISLPTLQKHFLYFKNLRITSVEVLLPFSDALKMDDLVNFVNQNIRIKSLIITSSPKEMVIQSADDSMGGVFSTKEIVNNCNYCGNIDSSNFCLSLKMISESMNFNNCLNRKISIDKYGFIKNCPSFNKNFGNIKDVKLATVVSNPRFKKYWYITKDKVVKCKDCEYRHICIDCRAHITDENNILSAPAKCNYDPYQCKWN